MRNNINSENLVDIRNITVDSSLPKEARIADYVRQIKDPYHFKCGNIAITASYSKDGKTIEECLHGLLA